MKISICGNVRSDIADFLELLLSDLNIEGFPPPEVLTKGMRIVSDYMEGDKSRAAKWMVSEVFGLGNRRPIDVLTDDNGLEQVERIIHQLEYGIMA